MKAPAGSPAGAKILLEVLDGGFKHTDVVLTGDVLVQSLADTLTVTHLAEDTAVGGGDAFEGTQRTVGVEVDVGSCLAAQIYVLGGDLAVCCQLGNQLGGSQELAFAVGDGDIDNVAHIHQAQPGALHGGDAGMNDAALVAADVVEGQGGAGLIGIDDLAVGNQTQLDQCLETVADTAHQTVTVVQQIGYCFLDRRITEERRDEPPVKTPL